MCESCLISLVLTLLVFAYLCLYLAGLLGLAGVGLDLLGLMGPYWALLGLIGPYWASLGLLDLLVCFRTHTEIFSCVMLNSCVQFKYYKMAFADERNLHSDSFVLFLTQKSYHIYKL